MATLWRIQDRATFAELRRRGRRSRRGPVTVTWMPGPAGEPPRVGYAVGRGVGKAVTRNRVKRRLRAVMSELAPTLAPGTYLLSAAPAAADLSFDEMRSTVSTAIAALAPAPSNPARPGSAA